MPRLTITLDDDAYAMARAHAVGRGLSLSKAIAELMRRSSSSGRSPGGASLAGEDPNGYFEPELGHRVSCGDGRKVTAADVRRAMDDDLVRPMEIMGLSPQAATGR